jgi:hypothetical protein
VPLAKRRYKVIITMPFGVTTRIFEAENEADAERQGRALLHSKDAESTIEVEEVGAEIKRPWP